MNNEKYYHLSKIDDNITELYIYGEIRKKDCILEWLGIVDDSVSAIGMKEALDKVETPKLRVRINSTGGSVPEALAIYSLLNDFQGDVETIVDGYACSAASIIFMAGSKRIVPKNGLLLIHNAWTSAEGDKNALRKVADDLEKITQPSVDIYLSKTNLTEKEIKEMMDKETWITSQEALEMGFATTVESQEPKQSLEINFEFVRNLVEKSKNYEKEISNLKNQLYIQKNQRNIIENADSMSQFFNSKK